MVRGVELGPPRPRVPPQPPLLGPRGLPRASARRPIRTGRAAGGGTSATPERYIEAVSAGRDATAADEVLDRSEQRLRGPRSGSRTSGRCASRQRCPTTTRSRRAGRAAGRDRAVLTVRGRLLANEVTIRLARPGLGARGANPSDRCPGMPGAARQTCWRRSSTSASGAASSSRRPRSTAASGPPTTTGRSASSCCATSRTPGGASMVQLRDDVVGIDAAILSPPRIWEASGHLANFTDPLVDCRNCHERWRADKIDGDLPQLRVHRPHRATGLQPHVQDLRRARRGGRHGRLPAPRDRPGDVRQLRQRPHHDPEEAALRHRPGRQVVPQRDHPAELRLPHPRVRADGDGVLRPPRRGRRVVRVLARRALRAGISTSASPRRSCACATTSPTSSRTTRPPPPTSSSSSPGAGTSSRASPTGPTTTCKAHGAHSGEKLEYFDQATGERYVPYVIEPAAGATRTMMAFLLAAYDEDEVGGETPHRAAPRPPAGAVPGGRAAAVEEGRARCRWRARCSDSLQPLCMCDYDTTQSIGRRYRRQDEVGTPYCVTVDFDSLEDRRRHGARPRHDRAGAGADRRASPRRSPGACAAERPAGPAGRLGGVP